MDDLCASRAAGKKAVKTLLLLSLRPDDLRASWAAVEKSCECILLLTFVRGSSLDVSRLHLFIRFPCDTKSKRGRKNQERK